MSYDEQSQIYGDCVAAANSDYYKTLAGTGLYQVTENKEGRKCFI